MRNLSDLNIAIILIKPRYFLLLATLYLFCRSTSAQTLGQLERTVDSIAALHNIDTMTLARSINLYAESLAKEGVDKKAIQQLLRVIDLFPKNEINEELGYTYNNLATILDRNNDPGAAIEYTHEAMRIFGKLLGDDHLYIGVIAKNLGIQYGKVQQNKASLRHLLKSDSILQNYQKTHLGLAMVTRRELVRVYMSQGELTKARRMLNWVKDKTTDIPISNKLEKLNFIELECDFYYYFSDQYTSEAIDEIINSNIQNAEKLFDPNDSRLTSLYNNYAIHLDDQDARHEESLKYFHKALSARIKNLDFFNVRDVPTVNQFLNPGDSDLKLLSNKAVLLEKCAKSENKEDHIKAALTTFEVGDSLAQKIRTQALNQLSRTRIRNEFYHFYVLYSAFCMNQIERGSSPQMIDRLFAIQEKIRNWDLIERYKAIDLDDDHRDTTLSEIARLGAQVKSTTWTTSGQSPERVDEQTELLKLADLYPEYFAMLYGFEVKTLTELRAFCDSSNTQWLQYFYRSPNRVGALVVTPDTVFVHTFSMTYDSLVTQIDSLTAQIERIDWKFAELAFDLYKELIQPIEFFLDQDQLAIVPFGHLWNLPFEMLLQQKPEDPIQYPDQYLINQYSTRYYTAAAMALSTRQSYELSSVALIAPEYRDENLSLSWSSDETKTIRKLVVDSETGKDKLAFRNALTNHDLIHFSGHTHGEAYAIDSNYILFDQDTMWLDEVLSIDSRAKLIVLSSCRSADGPSEADGLRSLTYAFALAGTPNLISNRWEAADQTSSRIMPMFYQALVDGKETQNALNQARLQYLQTSPLPGQHPFFWAGLMSQGNPLKYQAYKWRNKGLLTVALLLLAGLVGIFVIRKRTA